MKYVYVLIVIGLIALGGAVLSNKNKIDPYIAPETIEKEVIIEVDMLEAEKARAWKLQETQAKVKAQKAYEEVMRLERVESDLTVVREAQTQLDEAEIELMASSSFPVAQVQ